MRRLILLAPILLLLGCADRVEAESWLEAHLAKFHAGSHVVASECLKADSDGDGYVSCTALTMELVTTDVDPKLAGYVNMHGKIYGPKKQVAVECAGTWPHQLKWFQEGCRIPKAHAN